MDALHPPGDPRVVGGAPLRIIVGLGDAQREDALLPAMHPEAGFTAIGRCLDADQLLEVVRRHAGNGRGPGGADAVLVARDLHRLTRDRLTELRRLGVPLVVLGGQAGAAAEDASEGVGRNPDAEEAPQLVLPADASPADVCAALVDAARGERYRRRTTYGGGPPRAPRLQSLAPAGETRAVEAGAWHPDAAATGRAVDGETAALNGSAPTPATESKSTHGAHGAHGAQAAPFGVIVVAGGHGSPGRTTVAVALAAAFGAVAPTVLVDADTTSPSVAAHLDADPTRSLFMLAHAEPSSGREWVRALESELQPLAPRSPRGAVLCGVPKPEMRGTVSRGFLERCVAELRQRYRYVILDVGAELAGPSADLHRAALGLAERVLFVAAADPVGLWRAKTALDALRTAAPGPWTEDGLALVLNRHDRRHHHGRAEIEWNLGVPAAAVVPFDQAGAQRTLAGARPLVLDDRSRAGRALLELAGRLHGGQLLLPPEEAPAAGAVGPAPVRLVRQLACLVGRGGGVGRGGSGLGHEGIPLGASLGLVPAPVAVPVEYDVVETIAGAASNGSAHAEEVGSGSHAA
ncbi:MAG TPA: hypothetical protein VFN74_25260 [Chloroflexota bacterium]|nr:hypothetical protein [Chloroflexota bacterium]